MKSIQMSGSVQTASPYKLRIDNLYDDTKPVSTELSLDTAQPSIGLKVNYDTGEQHIVKSTINILYAYLF